MKRNLKAAAAGIATLAIASGGLLVSAGAASAASSAPPFEPDTNAAAPYSNVMFFDANGNQVTSGTNLSNPFSYAVALTPGDAGAIKANLAFAKPVSGTNPSLWTATAEAGPTNYSSTTSLPAGTPASIKAYAPTYPIVNTPGANISTFIAANPSDPNAGYANTIQVRLTDSAQASGTYWESDIAYNTTAAPITVDGTTVPANGWAQVFPFVNTTTTALTAPASGSTVTGGSALNLTATVTGASAGDTGTVAFLDGSTVIGQAPLSNGTAAFSYTPGPGSHSYTAEYLGDMVTPHTTTATNNGPSTSAASAVTVTAVPTATSVAVSANPIVTGDSDTFTATITEKDGATAGLPGSVQFYDIAPGGTAPGTALGSPVATTVSGTSATASVTSSALTAVGTHEVYATFTPTNTNYQPSTSAQTPVTVTNKVATTTGLTANPTASFPGNPVTLTASVTDANSNAAGVAGSVQFYDTPTGATTPTALGSPVNTTVSGTTGTASLVYSSLPQTTGSNADNVTAVFTPTSPDYVASTSPAVAVTVVPQGACSYSGSNCTNQSNVQVTVTNGSITITTPYTSSNPFTLPNMQLSSDGTFLYTCASFPATGVTATTPVTQSSCNDITGHNTAPGTPPGNTAPGTPPLGIVVTSTLNQNPDWVASVSASPLTGQVTGKTIAASGLGFTDGTTAYQSTASAQQKIAYANTAALNPSKYYTGTNGTGLGSTPVTFASTTGGGDGTTVMYGQLTLFAPTSTPADLYQGILTFTVTPGTNSNAL